MATMSQWQELRWERQDGAEVAAGSWMPPGVNGDNFCCQREDRGVWHC